MTALTGVATLVLVLVFFAWLGNRKVNASAIPLDDQSEQQAIEGEETLGIGLE